MSENKAVAVNWDEPIFLSKPFNPLEYNRYYIRSAEHVMLKEYKAMKIKLETADGNGQEVMFFYDKDNHAVMSGFTKERFNRFVSAFAKSGDRTVSDTMKRCVNNRNEMVYILFEYKKERLEIADISKNVAADKIRAAEERNRIASSLDNAGVNTGGVPQATNYDGDL